jgi:hypothetical protein
MLLHEPCLAVSCRAGMVSLVYSTLRHNAPNWHDIGMKFAEHSVTISKYTVVP